MTTESLVSATPTVEGDAFRYAMARLPTGVTVVTTRGAHGPQGCTVNAVMSLSLRPPTMLVSFTTGSGTLNQVLESGFFAVNVLPWSARSLARHFAVGTAAQRFANVPWEPEAGIPVLTAASVAAVCEVREAVSMFDHTLVAGAVVWTRTGEQPSTVLYGNGQYCVGG